MNKVNDNITSKKIKEFMDKAGKDKPETISLSNVMNILNGNIVEESDLNKLKSKIKEVEKKIKENNKPKTITISGEDHLRIKQYCSYLGFNIGDWATKTLLKEIKEHNCIIFDEGTTEEIQEKNMTEITNRYFNNKNRKMYLIKSNKILIHKDFRFVAYSMLDALPIYECTGDMAYLKMKYDFEDLGIKFDLITRREISAGILENEKLESIIF